MHGCTASYLGFCNCSLCRRPSVRFKQRCCRCLGARVSAARHGMAPNLEREGRASRRMECNHPDKRAEMSLQQRGPTQPAQRALPYLIILHYVPSLTSTMGVFSSRAASA